MARLKNTDKYAIQWLDYLGETPKDISFKLNIAEKDIVHFLEKYQSTNKENSIKTGTSLAGSPEDKNLMLTQSNKKQKHRTKEIEYSIRYLYETKGTPINDIAVELGVSEAIVESVVSRSKEEKTNKISKSQNLMIRQTANKKTNSVSVMTESASQANDELVKTLTPKSSRGSSGAIFRPNE